MGLKEKHGAKGSMILNHNWSEDNQGIGEVFNKCAKLEADSKDDAYVVLTVEDGKKDFRKNKNQIEYKYRISALDLINLISEKGQRI